MNNYLQQNFHYYAHHAIVRVPDCASPSALAQASTPPWNDLYFETSLSPSPLASRPPSTGYYNNLITFFKKGRRRKEKKSSKPIFNIIY